MRGNRGRVEFGAIELTPVEQRAESRGRGCVVGNATSQRRGNVVRNDGAEEESPRVRIVWSTPSRSRTQTDDTSTPTQRRWRRHRIQEEEEGEEEEEEEDE
ncbi:hypothetical protein EX30DRAFT_344690 [Ascodesmis nigricans]|uniref:Uncharacterized protein n=1 Tax=Ascodesmis nigricans TaxID=341454 RepID=A0A4S2MIP6_9PEZI|nr:hypothetical protein EX30DRAFT_344690 [Ascodesmis nigricans]